MTQPATIERRLLGKYFRTGFLGEDADQTTLCPVAIPGVSFDSEKAADVSPFTPDAVRDQVGYVELSLRKVDSWDSGTTSGMDTVGGSERMVSTMYTVTRCRFTIRVPGTADQELLETYEGKLWELFLGLSIVHDGPPKIHIRQLTQYPPTTWRDETDGDWTKRVIDIPVRRRERREHAGVQEVTL